MCTCVLCLCVCIFYLKPFSTPDPPVKTTAVVWSRRATGWRRMTVARHRAPFWGTGQRLTPLKNQGPWWSHTQAKSSLRYHISSLPTSFPFSHSFSYSPSLTLTPQPPQPLSLSFHLASPLSFISFSLSSALSGSLSLTCGVHPSCAPTPHVIYTHTLMSEQWLLCCLSNALTLLAELKFKHSG